MPQKRRTASQVPLLRIASKPSMRRTVAFWGARPPWPRSSRSGFKTRSSFEKSRYAEAARFRSSPPMPMISLGTMGPISRYISLDRGSSEPVSTSGASKSRARGRLRGESGGETAVEKRSFRRWSRKTLPLRLAFAMLTSKRSGESEAIAMQTLLAKPLGVGQSSFSPFRGHRNGVTT
jgi:hypothetical protein